MKKHFLLALFLLPAALFAQNVDSIFSETIRTVVFTGGGTASSGDGGNLPVGELGYSQFLLVFDDMSGDFHNFMYTIEQCDRDWKPSKLDRLEYLEGLSEDRITIFQNSQATNIGYVNYRLSVPNDIMRLSKSGNYILKIYEDDAAKTPVLTRRFIVVEPTPLSILTEFAQPLATNYNTHHEIYFRLDPKTFRIQNPMNDIRCTVLQNGRWDIARTSLPPQYVMGDKIVYEQRDSVTFWAGKEWRYVDLRPTRFRTERMKSIDQGDETWEVTLLTDLDRSREPYLIYPDLNGGFFIETQDYRNQNPNHNTQSDYVNCHFSLRKDEPFENADVYLFGKMTDWKIDPRFKMTYDERHIRYEGTAQLKQGFYNYQYLVVRHKPQRYETHLDFSALEGDWFAAENEYQIIVYYRPFGARYDRVIGFQKIQSNRK